MKSFRTGIKCLVAAWLLSGQTACAQMAAPAVPGATGGLGFFGSMAAMLQKSHAECCQTPLGQMMNSMTMPLSFMTGGLIPQKCANVNPAAGADPSSATGAAGAIAQNQADAKARAAAVRYLATADCHWYPEAEKSLIGSLRADPSECVRWEAAKALQTGCCCNKNTIDALTITVTGSSRDGNPSENSLRVRVEAYIALQLCMQKVDGTDQPPADAAPQPEPGIAMTPTLAPPLAETGPTEEQSQAVQQATAELASAQQSLTPMTYEQALAARPMAEVLQEARAALANAQLSSVGQVAQTGTARPGGRSLLTLWNNSAEPRKPAETATQPSQTTDVQRTARPARAPWEKAYR